MRCSIPTLSSAVIWYMITLWLIQVTVVNLQMFKTNKFYYWEADNRNVYSVEISILPFKKLYNSLFKLSQTSTTSALLSCK